MVSRHSEIIPSAQYERTPSQYVEPRFISRQVEPRYSSNTRLREPYTSSYLVPREPSYYDRRPTVSYERRPSHYYGSPTPHEAVSPRPTPGSQIDPTDPSGIGGVLIQDSYALIDRKMREFYEMNNRASELEAWVCFALYVPFLYCPICVLTLDPNRTI
jgi:hypothetical protein